MEKNCFINMVSDPFFDQLAKIPGGKTYCVLSRGKIAKELRKQLKGVLYLYR